MEKSLESLLYFYEVQSFYKEQEDFHLTDHLKPQKSNIQEAAGRKYLHILYLTYVYFVYE